MHQIYTRLEQVQKFVPWFRIAGALAAAIGLLCLIGGGIFYYTESNFVESAVETQGTVVEVVKERNSEGKVTYSFIYEYQDAEGNSHRAQPSVSTSPQQYFKGDTVPVLYDPDQPTSSEINAFTHLWLGPLIFGIVGLINLFFGGFLAWLLPRLITPRTAAHPQT